MCTQRRKGICGDAYRKQGKIAISANLTVRWHRSYLLSSIMQINHASTNNGKMVEYITTGAPQLSGMGATPISP